MRNDPLVGGLVDPLAAILVAIVQQNLLALLASIEDDVQLLRRQFSHRHIQGNVVVFARSLEQLGVIVLAALAHPGANGSFGQGQVAVGDDQFRVEFHLGPQARAGRTGAMGAVEREGTRLDVRQGHPTVDAGKVLREQRVLGLLSCDVADQHDAAAQLQGRLHRIGYP